MISKCLLFNYVCYYQSMANMSAVNTVKLLLDCGCYFDINQSEFLMFLMIICEVMECHIFLIFLVGQRLYHNGTCVFSVYKKIMGHINGRK